MRARPYHVYDAILEYFEVDDETLMQPSARMGGLLRACYCYILEHGLGMVGSEIATELGWQHQNGVYYATKSLISGKYDHDPRLCGMSGVDACRIICNQIAHRHDGVRCLGPVYGHTPIN